MPKQLSQSELNSLKECVKSNKSMTAMMAKTRLPKNSITYALKKYVGLSSQDISKLGTSDFKFSLD